MAQELEQYTHEDLVNFFICEKKRKKKKKTKNKKKHTHKKKKKNKKIGVDANKVGGLCLFFFFCCCCFLSITVCEYHAIV